ncbi:MULTISPECIES: hypothetical protein [Variovorax]|jgi:hypothetical protein|nr:hypothetical protein [Variovorax paradoxus]
MSTTPRKAPATKIPVSIAKVCMVFGGKFPPKGFFLKHWTERT